MDFTPSLEVSFIDLSEGYYNISITDNLNCSVYEDSILVDLNSNIILEIDSSLETCRLDDGLINIFAQNGYGGYQYSIDSGVNFSSSIYSDTLLIDSLTTGNYYLYPVDFDTQYFYPLYIFLYIYEH